MFEKHFLRLMLLAVVKSFIDKIKEKSIGLETNKNLTPGQTFLKIVEDELKQHLVVKMKV